MPRSERVTGARFRHRIVWRPFLPGTKRGAMIELMYQAQLTPWWMVQPDMQYIIRPGGGILNNDRSLRPNAWVVALRSALSF